MAGLFEVLGAIYEVSTVVTDVMLNNEYIKRGWKEEYALSIVFLVFNGIVMAIVGLQLESHEKRRRYVNVRWLNMLIGGVIGILQLRVLVETLYAYAGARREEKGGAYQAQNVPSGGQQQQHQETEKERLQRMKEGLVFAAFVQAMVRDVPLFVIQANATIHYRKWKLVDIWAVSSTGVTLINAISGYVKKNKQGVSAAETGSTTLGFAATLFLIGQFVFRLGAILLVATTTGYAIVAYSLAITTISIAVVVVLKTASPAQATGAQLASAVLFFPLFTVFALDASHLHPQGGSTKDALWSGKLIALNAWRVFENAVGVVLAASLPRYTDFGKSTDEEIAYIGVACGAVFVVSFIAFFLAVRSSSESPEMGEDTTLYLRNNQPNYVRKNSSDHQGVQAEGKRVEAVGIFA